MNGIRKLFTTALVILMVLGSTELFLRLFIGFGNPALLQGDPEIGYLFMPNQSGYRYSNHYHYNQFSQRSRDTTEKKTSNTFRILMIGDSVLNGGYPTDQNATISNFLEKQLTQSSKPVEVLNASCGSWSIRNQLAYLKKFGFFESNITILQIGPHDLTQPKSHSEKINHHPNFPGKKPTLAITEAFTRYIAPAISSNFRFGSKASESLRITEFLNYWWNQNFEAIQEIKALSEKNHSRLIILFTPQRSLLKNPIAFKSELEQWCLTNKIAFIDILKYWEGKDKKFFASVFRDNIHFTPLGHKHIAEIVSENLRNQT